MCSKFEEQCNETLAKVSDYFGMEFGAKVEKVKNSDEKRIEIFLYFGC